MNEWKQKVVDPKDKEAVSDSPLMRNTLPLFFLQDLSLTKPCGSTLT
ncbi:hypothetical protein [Alkaliphilus metalliredigens]|nr:hypothetical protein [Alkaliphilus metalliredigens]